MKKFIKRYFILLFVLSLFLILSAYSYVSAISSNLSNSVFRLHVIANSDTKEDQDLKYKVRDGLIEYMKTLTSSNNTKEEVIKIASEHKEDFKNIEKKIVVDNGYDSGFYDALKVEIGNSKGQNWWCVMFPPLCFVDVNSGVVPDESKENLEENLSEEEYNLISNDSDITNFKFKIVELFENIGIKLANN